MSNTKMYLFGITFLLFMLKLSDGKGFWVLNTPLQFDWVLNTPLQSFTNFL